MQLAVQNLSLQKVGLCHVIFKFPFEWQAQPVSGS